MRFSMIFAIAVTVASAAPAAAQNNAAANTATNLAVTPENVTAVNLTETNAATAATPAVQGPDAAEAETVTVTGKKPFPWGVLGLVGLIGLLGRRRST